MKSHAVKNSNATPNESYPNRDGQKPEFFENPGFGFDPGFKMKNPGFSG